jgi:hypothetical protein
MVMKSTTEWQMKSPALGHPSTSMDKPTTAWQRKSPQIARITQPTWNHPPTNPPTDDNIWPTNLIEIIRAIKQIPPRQPSRQEFSFELSDEAAEKNFLILMRKYGGCLSDALAAQEDSMVGYGSEFRDVATLANTFQRHPNWTRMSRILTHSSEWPLEPLNNKCRLADVREALIFGNHKGASMKPDLLLQLMSKDVQFSYCLPLPLAKAEKIPGILIAPMNIQQQNTINEFGRIVPKDRQTHDQSFKWSSGTSVNSRVKTEELLPCLFWCMHQADRELGRHRPSTLSQRPNPGLQNRFQVGLPTVSPQ